MTLGGLIAMLEVLSPVAEVRMDCGTVPTKLCSWRGVYADLTLDHRGGSSGPTVAALLYDSRAAVGGTFRGYKGGEYTMDKSTPVWADPWGDCFGRAITGIAIKNGIVEIQTFVLPEEYR